MSAAHDNVAEQMLRIELAQMTKAATLMAKHILAQPAEGMAQVSEVRQVARQVLGARVAGSAT